MLLTLMLWGAPASAACPEASSPSQLGQQLTTAEQAYANFDIDDFRSSMDAAAAMLPCLDAVISRQLAARYHQMQGLLASVVREQARARQAFLAARAADPDYSLPETLFSVDHPIRLDYAALPLDGVVWQDVPPPREGALLVDGQASTQLPQTRPAIVQRTDAVSEVAETTYLWPGETYAYDAVPERASRRSVKLLAVAGGLGASAALLTGLAASSAGDYHSSSTLDDYDQLRRRTNTLNALAIGTGSAAGLAGAGALLVWDW